MYNYTAIAQAQTLLEGVPFYSVQTPEGIVLQGLLWIFFSVILLMVGSIFGYKEGLRYVWRTGIPHSQKENDQVYLRWKHKIKP